MLSSVLPRLTTDLAVRVFPGNFSLFKTPFLRWISVPTFFVSFFIFYICPTSFQRLLFWVPDVLCQHSEVVLWNLFGVQMFFQWICGGESGLLVLFLRHLRTASDLLSWLCFSRISCCNKLGEENLKHGLEPLKFGFILMLETTLWVDAQGNEWYF